MSVVQERDRVHAPVVIAIAIATATATGIGVVLAWQIQGSTERSIGASAEPIAARWGRPPDDLDAIEMSLLGPRSGPPDQTSPVDEHRSGTGVAGGGASRNAALHRYGWRDRERGTVHIPIDRAILLYLARTPERAAASPRTAPTTGEPPGVAPRRTP